MVVFYLRGQGDNLMCHGIWNEAYFHQVDPILCLCYGLSITLSQKNLVKGESISEAYSFLAYSCP